jgi:predicted DNA-binding protein (MmcQ/YjbR family)
MPNAEVDPQFRLLWEHCAALPGAVARRRWGESMFRVRGLVFAFMGSPAVPAVTVKVSEDVRPRVLRHPSVRRAHYVGRLGWLTVCVRDGESLRLALELVDRSYALAAAGRRRRT